MEAPEPVLAAGLAEAVDRLSDFVRRHPRLVVLTGAGCSTESGIPDYRDPLGAWKRPPPVQYQDFMQKESARRRYWARSMVGFPLMAAAAPNATHRWLVEHEAAGGVELLVTQNVDGLHQQAGSRDVVDLHGRISDVVCVDCGMQLPRSLLQTRLESLNGALMQRTAGPARAAPDGDADVEGMVLDDFRIPRCDHCNGTLKPAVVFFGESVPKNRVSRTMASLGEADALLVLGSSLMVYSGFRFCREAARLGMPIASVSLGTTRADDLLELKLEARCGALFEQLSGSAPAA